MEGLVVALARLTGIDSELEYGAVTHRRLGYFSFTFESRGVLDRDLDETAHKQLARALKKGEYPLADIELV